MSKTRTERDSMGELEVPANALWGAQTQRAVNNFAISPLTLPRPFIRALGLIKAGAAHANTELELLDEKLSEAIQKAASAVADGEYDEHFPVDVFQTGSGTSSNMNANEVIAHLATRSAGKDVHPNDHVNMCQSSNDVIPTAIRVSAVLECEEHLLPALEHLSQVLEKRAKELDQVAKTGRTHLMDAMPVTFGQELFAWQSQVNLSRQRIQDTLVRLRQLPLGGTAVGTGINAHPEFAEKAVAQIAKRSGIAFACAENAFEGIGSQDTPVELSGQLRVLAVSLMKIANDLRWMNSGPLAGLGEIELPSLQPGSSIMPGKVNPVIAEATAMVSAQVIGNDATITVAGQSGNFELNVMLPVIAYNLLQSIDLSANASRRLADLSLMHFTVNAFSVNRALARNPILVTALNSVIGYEKGAAIAKQAYKEGRPVRDVAIEETDLSEEELDRLLDPLALTQGGIAGQ